VIPVGWLNEVLRSKDTDEYQDRLRVQETQLNLALVESFVLDSHVVARHTFDSDNPLALVKEVCT
jgi:hypothetical protein